MLFISDGDPAIWGAVHGPRPRGAPSPAGGTRRASYGHRAASDADGTNGTLRRTRAEDGLPWQPPTESTHAGHEETLPRRGESTPVDRCRVDSYDLFLCQLRVAVFSKMCNEINK